MSLLFWSGTRERWKSERQATVYNHTIEAAEEEHRGLALQLSGKYMPNLDTPQPPQVRTPTPQCITCNPLQYREGGCSWEQAGLMGTGGMMNAQQAETGPQDSGWYSQCLLLLWVTLKNLTPATSHLIHKGAERDRTLTKGDHIKESGYHPDFLINTIVY